MRITNCFLDTRIRAGNWWGNGEPIFLMAVPHDSHLPFDQRPHTSAECAIRNVYFSGITCIGENAMGIVGMNGNIRDITMSEIDYTRKPSDNLALKGCTFDLAPSAVTCEVPEECGLRIRGAENVRLEQVNTRNWRIIQEP